MTTTTIVQRATRDFTPYAHNPRKNDQAVDRMVASIREFGFKVQILCMSDGLVVDGHLRLKAAIQLGLADVPAILCDDWSDEQVKAFRLMANRSVTWADWDHDLLALELQGLQAAGFDLAQTGFESHELDEFLVTEAITEDSAPALPTGPTITNPGDIWILGPHRLLCGDSTDLTNVRTLMDGAEASLVFTDPPYGVDYVGKTEEQLTIENDDLGDEGTRELIARATRCWPLKPGGAWYVCSPPGNTETAFRLGLQDAGQQLRQCLVWVKQQFVMGRQDYHWRHESILYGWQAGAAHYFLPDFTQDTVLDDRADVGSMNKAELLAIVKEYRRRERTSTWEEDRPSASRAHPTMKPLGLVAKAIRNSSRRHDVVFDGFAGSGQTLLACEPLERRCYAMEIDPHYCDVIVERWNQTHDIATREAR
jgi:DNA modification methylase